MIEYEGYSIERADKGGWNIYTHLDFGGTPVMTKAGWAATSGYAIDLVDKFISGDRTPWFENAPIIDRRYESD